jgi:hypothetical protein
MELRKKPIPVIAFILIMLSMNLPFLPPISIHEGHPVVFNEMNHPPVTEKGYLLTYYQICLDPFLGTWSAIKNQ